MSIAATLLEFKKSLPPGIKLVAITKTKSEETILKAYQTGHKQFGENKVQELVQKYENLPKDIEWHMVGHLQSNKVKYIASFIGMIHSVDSFNLLETINKEAIKNKRIIDCLLQLRIAAEDTKFGFLYEEIEAILNSNNYQNLKNIKIAGLMGMATFTENKKQIENEFNYMTECFEKLKKNYFIQDYHFKEMSMGMSEDYLLAIKAGATIIRIGNILFGERNYQK